MKLSSYGNITLDFIDVVTDYKKLEYFSTTKLLIWQQVQWLWYLFPVQHSNLVENLKQNLMP